MKKLRVFIIVITVVIACLALAPAAFAHNKWIKVGGYPLIKGGVKTEMAYSHAMLTNHRVTEAYGLVDRGDGLGSWVLADAKIQVQEGRIHIGNLFFNTLVGYMSYGFNGFPLVLPDTLYVGQDNPLHYYYVVVSKTSKVVVGGKHYCEKLSYQVCMAQPCANVFVFKKKITKKQLFPLYVQKQNTCYQLLAGFHINGTVGGAPAKLVTSATALTLVGYYLPGTSYDLSEVNQTGYEIVKPVSGNYTGKTKKSELILTYIDQLITPSPTPSPSPTTTLQATACVTPGQCNGTGTLSATFNVSANESNLTMVWSWNGQTETTSLLSLPVTLCYNVVYFASVTVTDQSGNQVQITLSPFDFVGAGSPPNAGPIMHSVIEIGSKVL